MSLTTVPQDRKNWLNSHSKHLFILTSAGKPVFSLHEEFGPSGLALCALVRALSSKTGDKLEVVTGSDGLRLIFCRHGELLLVCSLFPLAQSPSFPTTTEEFALAQLELLYLHILFHVTKPALESLFVKNASYDLASLLGGTEVEARNLMSTCETELSFTLDAIPVLAVPQDTRLALTEALEEVRQGLAPFAFLIGKQGQLICGLGPNSNNNNKQRFGRLLKHTRNYLLLANFVRSNPQLSSTQMWTPLCLPLFDDSGHFQVYCSCVLPPGSKTEVFLLLLTADSSLEHFHQASEKCALFIAKMNSQLTLASSSSSSHDQNNLMDEEEDELLHVAVKYTKDDSIQYVQWLSKRHPTYPMDVTGSYLVQRYSEMKNESMMKVVWDAKTRDCVLWARADETWEFFCLFTPLTTQTQAVQILARIKAQVQKNKANLFCFPASM